MIQLGRFKCLVQCGKLVLCTVYDNAVSQAKDFEKRVQSVKENYNKAEAALKQAKADFENAKSALENNGLENAQKAYDIAKTNLENAQKTYNQAKAEWLCPYNGVN